MHSQQTCIYGPSLEREGGEGGKGGEVRGVRRVRGVRGG